jgi:hypothetical protein
MTARQYGRFACADRVLSQVFVWEAPQRVPLGVLVVSSSQPGPMGCLADASGIAGMSAVPHPATLCWLYWLSCCADGPVKKGRLTDSAGPTSKLFRLAAAHAGAAGCGMTAVTCCCIVRRPFVAAGTIETLQLAMYMTVRHTPRNSQHL